MAKDPARERAGASDKQSAQDASVHSSSSSRAEQARAANDSGLQQKLSSEISAAPKYDKERREARYPVPFEIEVSGIDHHGRMFRQEARTHSVSTWGCGFLSTTQLKKGDIISIRVLSGPGKETGFTPQLPFQVVYVKREGEAWSIGSVKIEEGEMWGADLKSLAHSHGFFSK